jgi:hypothetical protein
MARAVVLVALLVVPSVAAAQAPPPAAATAEADVGPEPQLTVGGQLDLVAAGNFDIKVGNNEAGIGANSSLGVEGLIDYRVSQLVTIGLAPRIIAGLRPNINGAGSGTEYDARARVTVGNYVAPKLRIHGIGDLGYSWISHIFTVNGTTGNSMFVTPHGLLFVIGAGMTYTVAPRLRITGEISQQWGFQNTDVMGTNIETHTSFLTLGVGLVGALD